MQAAPNKANLKFLASLDEPLVYIPSKGGGDATEHVGKFTMHEVTVHNGRQDKQDACLDVEGFKLVRRPSSVDDFFDHAKVNTTYHEEVRSLVIDVTGGARVEVFDDTRRSTSLERQKVLKVREAADIVHNDYTARSGIKRLRDHFADDPDEAESLSKNRFAIVNVWRSMSGPVHNHPLTLCDAATVRPEDLIAVERRADERIGEIQVSLFNPGQHWYYFPEMQMDEALLFKTFDSATDGRARFTIHTSFEDPHSPAGAPPRESIETRCLVFF